MRVLFLALDVDLAKQRGDTVHAVELALALSSIGHELTFVCGRDGPARRFLPPEVRVCVAAPRNPGTLHALSKLAREFRPDVVYERRTTPKMSFALRALAGVPVVMEVNGVLKEELTLQGRSARGRPLEPARGKLRAAMFRRVDRLIAISRGIADDLVAEYGIERDRIVVIGNGVNTARFRPIPKEEACRRIRLDPGAPRLVFVGNLAPWRDLDLLVSTIEVAVRKAPAANLLVLGSGEGEARLRTLAEERGVSEAVTLEGEVGYDRVPDFIGSSDVALLPDVVRSIDVSPLKVFEYLACERPVVATGVPGLDFVEERGLGRLAPAGDAEAFAAAAVDLLTRPEERQAMGRRGRAYVEAERTWASVAARITRVLEEVAGSNR